MFGTPSPTAVAAAAVGTQVRSALWGVGGSHQQCCPFPSLVQPPFPSPSWDSSWGPAGPCPSKASFQGGPSPLLCAALSFPRPGCSCFSSSCCCGCCYCSCPAHTISPSGCGSPRPVPSGMHPYPGLPPSLLQGLAAPPSWKHTQLLFNTPTHPPTHFGGETPLPLSSFQSSGCSGSVSNFLPVEPQPLGTPQTPFLSVEHLRGVMRLSQSPRTPLSPRYLSPSEK